MLHQHHEPTDQDHRTGEQIRTTLAPHYALDSAAATRVWHQVQQHIHAAPTPKTSPGSGWWVRQHRRIVLATITVLVLLGGLLALPPVRTLAQALLVRIGVLDVTTDPTWVQQAVADPTTQVFVGDPVIQSLEEAQHLLGDIVFVPEYMPSSYGLTGRGVAINDDSGLRVGSTYSTGVAFGSPFVSIEQWAPTAKPRYPFGVSTAAVTEIRVRGRRGLWVADAPVGPRIENGQLVGTVNYNGLLWEEDGRTFRLYSDSLGQDDLLRIAESLRP